jgi:hypothetical protein
MAPGLKALLFCQDISHGLKAVAFSVILLCWRYRSASLLRWA